MSNQVSTPTPQPVTSGTTVTAPAGATSDTNVTGQYALIVKGAAPTGMMGKNVYAALMDANGLVIGNANSVVDTSGVTLSFPGKVDNNMRYSVAYYIDRNGNGFCNIADPNDPNADYGYMVNANITSTSTTVNASANGNTFVCSAFGAYAFDITGADFGPHNNEYVFVALMDTADNTFVAGPANQLVLNSTWRFAFASVMLPGHTYQARYWIDQTRTDTCENHSWVYTLPAPASGNTEASVSHDQPQTAVCSNFPLTLPPD